MIRFKFKLGGLWVCWVLIGLVFNVHGQTAIKNHWKRHELGNGNLSVLLPTEPSRKSVPAIPEAVIKVSCEIFTVEWADGSFVVSYCTIDESSVAWTEANKDRFYDGIWTGLSETYEKFISENKLSYALTVSSKRDMRFGGHQGHEVAFAAGPWHGRIRMTATGRHAFIASDFGTDKLSTADRQKFFDSIILKPKSITVDAKKN